MSLESELALFAALLEHLGIERCSLVGTSCGAWDAAIAEQLVLSPHTVHRHVANIRAKLNLPSRAAAAAFAVRAGLD
jgi:DNA-binding NarL/FixJ family response regulator